MREDSVSTRTQAVTSPFWRNTPFIGERPVVIVCGVYWAVHFDTLTQDEYPEFYAADDGRSYHPSLAVARVVAGMADLLDLPRDVKQRLLADGFLFLEQGPRPRFFWMPVGANQAQPLQTADGRARRGQIVLRAYPVGI